MYLFLFCARKLFPPNKASAQTKGRSHWIKVAQNQKRKKYYLLCVANLMHFTSHLIKNLLFLKSEESSVFSPLTSLEICSPTLVKHLPKLWKALQRSPFWVLWVGGQIDALLSWCRQATSRGSTSWTAYTT